MRINLLIFICLLPLLSISQQRWYSSFGRPGEREKSVCLSKSYDKGYLITGQYYNAEGLVVKTSVNGELRWDKVFIEGNNRILFYKIVEKSFGRKVLLGYTGPDPVIICLNACGEVEWCNTFQNPEHFEGGYFIDAIVYEDGHTLALGFVGTLEQESQIYLFYFDPDGDLLWMKRYAKAEDDPDLGYHAPHSIDTIGNDFIISGYCYYRRNDNPDVFTLRPMFIKIDENYEEEWLLPYGHIIDLAGSANGVLRENDSTYRGFGRYNAGSAYNGVMLNFNTQGIETNHVGIPNQLLSDSITNNYMIDIERINDSLFMAAAIYVFSHTDIDMGEYVVSTTGNVHASQFHTNTTPAFRTMVKTDNSQFVFAGDMKQSGEWDIFLYKLNDDLSSAPVVTDTITYDYLCDDLPIVSDTIDLSACGIITGIGEIPTPEEYYASLETIPVKVHPNPAKDKIKMETGKSGVYKGYRVRCYNTSGRIMYENTIVSETGQLDVDVSEWQSGIYVVVVTDDKGRKGNAKFVVE